jgi:RNA polymerase sigma-70 factor (ECF subfamily)
MIIPMPQSHRDAFEEAAWPHRPALSRLALRLARRADVADDLVQETYLRAFRAFHSYEAGTNMRAWLFRILRHAFINRYRAERARPAEVEVESIEDVARAASDPESHAMDSVLPDELGGALAELPPSFRAVVQLAWLDELSYQEIAERLSIPIGTVMSRIYRARKMLQDSLREFGASRGLIQAPTGDRRLVA